MIQKVIFPGTDIDSAYNASERIRSEVEKHLLEGGIRITISGGVRQYSGEAPEELIRAADSRLYEAKRKGKNLVIK